MSQMGSFPTGRKLESGTSGRPQGYLGTIGDGLDADASRVAYARRQFREAEAADFEPAGRKLWRDRTSGQEYQQADGNPLHGTGDQEIVCFLVVDGRLVFLRSGVQRAETRYLGEMGGVAVAAAEPSEGSIW